MSLTRPDYGEGDWFAVPLRDGGFGAGVVARVGKKGTFLGYFFGPRHKTVPQLDELLSQSSTDAALVAIAGDLGIVNGDWKRLGKAWNWRRDRWPVPGFLRRDGVTGGIYRVTYTDDDLITEKTLDAASESDTGLPEDGIWGYGAIEKRLSRLLAHT